MITNLAVLLAAATCFAFGRWSASRHQSGPDGPGALAQLDQARAEIRDLRGQLADATESAHAAWDAASDRTPRRTTKDADEAANERLATTPMSGVRRIGGQQPGA
jgi:hypothetical protein